MKYISYILMGISVFLAIIALVLLLKQEGDRRSELLGKLEKARDGKADVKERRDELRDIEGKIVEVVQSENKKDNGSKKETIGE